MDDFRSHFQEDFLAYCTKPVRVHLAMPCIGCLFNSFSVFLLSLKQQNRTEIIFSLYSFSNTAISPPKYEQKNIVNFIECFYVNDEPESKFLYTETIKLYNDFLIFFLVNCMG